MRSILALALSISLLTPTSIMISASAESIPPQGQVVQTIAPAAASAPVVQTGITQTAGVAQTQEAAVITDEQAREMIRVSYSPVPLKSKLRKMYTAYQVTLTSDYPGMLNVQSANITNGTPGVAAAQTMYTSRANMWWGALLGLGGVIVIGLPILGVISSSNSKAEKESIAFPNQISVSEIQQGDSVSFKALTLLGQTPQISLSLKDPKTGLRFTKNAR